MRPRQDGRYFADDVLKCIFLNENVWIPIKISLKFVPKDPINNIPALVQIMARRRPGDKPLSEPMMVNLLIHICVTRPQWVKKLSRFYICIHSCVYLYSFTFRFTKATHNFPPWASYFRDPSGMGSANERRRYMVRPSLIGWAHTQKDLCIHVYRECLGGNWLRHNGTGLDQF